MKAYAEVDGGQVFQVSPWAGGRWWAQVVAGRPECVHMCRHRHVTQLLGTHTDAREARL